MKTVVIYKSRTGFTKRYAEWTAQDTGASLMRLEDASADALRGFELVVYGGRVHAGKLDGLARVKALLFTLGGDVKLALFATGATPSAESETIQKMWEQNLSGDELVSVPHFYFQSGLNYVAMGVGDKTLMKALAAFLGAKKNKSDSESGCENAIASSYDISSQDYVLPLVEYIKSAE